MLRRSVRARREVVTHGVAWRATGGQTTVISRWRRPQCLQGVSKALATSGQHIIGKWVCLKIEPLLMVRFLLVLEIHPDEGNNVLQSNTRCTNRTSTRSLTLAPYPHPVPPTQLQTQNCIQIISSPSCKFHLWGPDVPSRALPVQQCGDDLEEALCRSSAPGGPRRGRSP